MPRSAAKLDRKSLYQFHYQGSDDYGPYDRRHEQKSN